MLKKASPFRNVQDILNMHPLVLMILCTSVLSSPSLTLGLPSVFGRILLLDAVRWLP